MAKMHKMLFKELPPPSKADPMVQECFEDDVHESGGVWEPKDKNIAVYFSRIVDYNKFADLLKSRWGITRRHKNNQREVTTNGIQL